MASDAIKLNTIIETRESKRENNEFALASSKIKKRMDHTQYESYELDDDIDKLHFDLRE